MPFSNYSLVFLPSTLKMQKYIYEYQLAIYGSHRIQTFINIIQATTEVPGQTPPTFMGKGAGFKSVKYYMNYIKHTIAVLPKPKREETLLPFCQIPRKWKSHNNGHEAHVQITELKHQLSN